ncbi:SH2 domain-containing adapter protein F-like isoform X2 [Liolophura sinensis]|uniref:SH2 domain-containing adapter protein F-like isoform X2 n=1 Tax=Liolophura sinensis TaxID=3198878 RepID=UPI0031587009
MICTYTSLRDGLVRPGCRQNIVIGEYTQPVDALLPANLKSVPPSTPSDEDYSEPYESRKLLEELQAQALLQPKDVSEIAGGVYSEAYMVPEVQASVYNLAKDTSSAKLGGDRLSRFRAQGRNWAQGSASRAPASTSRLTSASSEDKENTDSDYDKLGYASGYDRVDGASGEQYGSLYVEGSAFRPVKPQARSQGEVTYQDPWDRSTAEKDLEEKLSSPKSRLGGTRGMLSSSHDTDNGGKGFSESGALPSNYCQPWDLKSAQQQFQESIHSSRSPPTQNSPVKHSSGVSGGARPRKGSGGRIIEGGVYEAPWDSEEKQKELEEKFKAAEIQKSPKKDGSKESSPKSGVRSRAVEDITVYEEPWDVSSKGRAISSMLSGTGEQKESSAPKSPGSKDGTNTSPKQKAGIKVDIGARIRSAIGEVIDPTIKLEKQSWYHGTIGRSDAEALLRVCKEGSYLVRNSESTKTDYSLSMKSSRGFIHIKISRDKDYKFILGENSQPFEAIPEMIFHYSRNLLPIKGADHMILLHPVINELL